MTAALQTPTALSVPKSDAAGKISSGWLDLTTLFTNIVDTTFSVVDAVDPTKSFAIEVNAGMTANKRLTLDIGAQTDNWSLTVPVLAASDIIAVKGLDNAFGTAQTVVATNGLTTLPAATQDALRVAGRAGGTGSYIATLTVPVLAASVTHTLPAITTTLAGLAVAQTFTAAQIMSSTLQLDTSSNGLTISKTSGTTLVISSSTDSTSPTSGAGTVAGGFGIAKQMSAKQGFFDSGGAGGIATTVMLRIKNYQGQGALATYSTNEEATLTNYYVNGGTFIRVLDIAVKGASDNTNGASAVRFLTNSKVSATAAVERVRVDDGDGTAGNTGLMLWDVDNNTVERVTVGAADSGGLGYKLLRIPN